MRPWWQRLGLRREVSILLPVALLLLVLLSTFTLFSYRSAIHLLVDSRQREAARLAQSVARRLATGDLPTSGQLGSLAPQATAVALLTRTGVPLVRSGDVASGDLLAPLAGRRLRRPVGLGPGSLLANRIAGFAALGPAARGRFVRLDLSAEILAAQQRSLKILTWVVLGVNGALTILVVLFLRHLLVPYETLLERARQMGSGEEQEEQDETVFLVQTFERALRALAGEPERAAEDDIALLQRTLTSSLESGSLLLDRSGVVLALNPVGAKLLEVESPASPSPLAEVLGRHATLRETLAKAIDAEQALQRAECEIEVSGARRTLGLTVHPLRRDDGTARGYLVLFADLTEARRQAEAARLEESLSHLAELAAGVAHELRNSVATLRGYLTLIERRPEEESLEDYLKEIRREADQLQRVVDDFLTFASPATARSEEVDLAEVVRRAAADPVLEAAAIRIEAAKASGMTLRGDPQLLQRALRNLLYNAVEAQCDSGRSEAVEVTLGETDVGLEVAIADRGGGLPPEVRQRLFHPFVTTRAGGVGLGLALTHRIVVLHGGQIRLEDRPGGGTRAVLSFPDDTLVT